MYKVVKVLRNGSEGLARCRNISESGMKLDVAMPLCLNDNVTIELTAGRVLSARVVWTNGSECGVAFDRSVDCTELLSEIAEEKRQDRARSPRLKSRIPARIMAEGAVSPATICNISQRGMLVAHSGTFRPGLSVKVMLDGGQERDATVQWTHENFAGLFLSEAYSVMELSDLGAIGQRAD